MGLSRDAGKKYGQIYRRVGRLNKKKIEFSGKVNEPLQGNGEGREGHQREEAV